MRRRRWGLQLCFKRYLVSISLSAIGDIRTWRLGRLPSCLSGCQRGVEWKLLVLVGDRGARFGARTRKCHVSRGVTLPKLAYVYKPRST